MPQSVSLDSGVQRIVHDEVVTPGELAWLARLRQARDTPGDIPAKLDQYEAKMTPAGQDRYAGFKAALQAPPQNGNALDVLSGRVRAPARLPAWYGNYDLAHAAAGIKQILAHQAANRGKQAEDFAPGSVENLDFWDIDLTLKRSDSPVILVKRDDPTHVLHYPNTPDMPPEIRGRIVYLGIGSKNPRDFALDMHDLQTDPRFRDLPWADYAPDFRAFGDPEPLLRAKFVEEDVDEMQKAQRDPKSRAIVNTARSDGLVPELIADDLLRRGIDINGAFPVNNPDAANTIGMPQGLSSAQKKAIFMAATIAAYGPENLKRVRFFDDTDANQIAAMQLLPKLFPDIDFRFVDVIHAKGRYHQHLAARTRSGGDLVDAQNKPMSVEARDGYKSSDGLLPFENIFGHDPADVPQP
jgi:hypothetical protein